MKSALCLLGLVLPPLVVAGVDTPEAASAPMCDSLAPLLQDLRSKDTETRIRAAKALSDLGSLAAPAARTLVAALADPEEKVREHVVDALTEIGPPAFRQLSKVVQRGDAQTRLLAIDVCSRIGGSLNYKAGDSSKDISPALIGCLSDKDPLIRAGAIRCLANLRTASSVPRLVKLLEEEKDIEIRLDAILACGQIGKEAKQAVPVLARMVVSEFGKIVGNYEVGGTAAHSLVGIGEPAVPSLACLIADVNIKSDIRCTVLSALAHESMVREVKFPTAAPAICKAMADRNEEVRLKAIYALHALDSTDKDVRGALQAAMTRDNSPHVRINAAVALYNSGHQVTAVIPTLIAGLENKEAAIRCLACSALQDVGRPASGAIPNLIHLMGDACADVRLAAIKALSRMGPGILVAIPALSSATNDSNREIRAAAIECLRQAQRMMRQP